MGYTYTNAKLDEITLSGDKRSLHGEKNMSPLICQEGKRDGNHGVRFLVDAKPVSSVFGSTGLAVEGYLVPAWSMEK